MPRRIHVNVQLTFNLSRNMRSVAHIHGLIVPHCKQHKFQLNFDQSTGMYIITPVLLLASQSSLDIVAFWPHRLNSSWAIVSNNLILIGINWFCRTDVTFSMCLNVFTFVTVPFVLCVCFSGTEATCKYYWSFVLCETGLSRNVLETPFCTVICKWC